MINLIKNAIKFTNQGEIIISYWYVSGKGLMMVNVKDTGIGIKSEDLKKLFQPFGRLDHKISNNSEGIGLGLTIVKALVTQNGGTIEVNSDGLNQGTTF